MSRVQSIIDNARIVLSDTNKTRYSDPVLVKYLNDGLNDFVLNTKILKERLFLELNTTAAIYDLSPYVLEFLRFQFMTKVIPVMSQEELDKLDKDWQNTTGDEVKCVTLSDMKKGFLRIYPRVTKGADVIDQNSLYGGLVDITINDDDYQIPSINDIESGLENYLVVFVVKKPKTLTLSTTDSELELGSEYDLALEYYITARALRSDMDSLNRAFGAEQLQLYNNYVAEASLSNTTGNQSVGERVVNYRGRISWDK